MKSKLAVVVLLICSTSISAETSSVVDLNIPAEGTISTQEGLEAFSRIYEVVSHPRCANCHVDERNIPMWTLPDGTTRPHGMNINAGESRIGAETVPCSTCHVTSDDLETMPHAAPRFGIPWQLAPAEFIWFDKTIDYICNQLKDPERNGGRDWQGLLDHLVHDASLNGPVLWGWNPGGNREPAPYSLQEHVDDMAIWGVAGQPCPTN